MGDSSKGAFLTGFLLGGLAGAAGALLMTPQSGETTRLQIRDRGIELKTQFSDLTTGLQERGKLTGEENNANDSATSKETVETLTTQDEIAVDEVDA